MTRFRPLAALSLVVALASGAPAQEPAVTPSAAPPISGELFPVCYQNGTYRIPAGFPGVLLFTFKGDPKTVKEAWLALDLPPGVELVGAVPWLPTRTVDNSATWDAETVTPQGTVKHDGKDYSRSVIALNNDLARHLRPDQVLWGRKERVYLKTWPGMAGKNLKVYWSLLTRAGETPAQSFALTVLPALEPPAKKLQRFNLMACKLGSATAPFPAVQDAYYRYWLSLHERPYILGEAMGHVRLRDELRDRFSRDFRWVGMVGAKEGGTPQLNLDRWLTFAKRVKADGKIANDLVCPSFLIQDPEDRIWDKAAPEGIRQYRLLNQSSVEAMIWDFEPGAMEFCFCDVCRKNFAAFAGLADTPDTQTIKSQHAKKWFDFRVDQHAKINAKFAGMVKKHFPKTQYWICTDNLHDGSHLLSEWCGCDERLFDPDVDLHLPMIYYAGLQFYKDVALNVKSLQKPVFVLVDPAEQLEMFFSRYTPLKIKQDIVACAALGAVGIGFWPEDYLDGAYLANIAAGTGMVAQAESYYFGTRDDTLAEVKVEPVFEKTIDDGGKKSTLVIPSLGEKIQATVHAAGQGRLVTVFNYDEANDAILQVRVPGLPAGAYWVRDLESDRVYLDADRKPLTAEALAAGFLSKVNASDVVVIEVSQNHDIEKGIAQAEFQKEIDAARAKLGGPAAFAGATQGEATADWGDVDGNGVPEVRLELPLAKAYVDLAQGANVTGWVVKATGEDLLAQGKDRGLLGELVPYDLKGAVWAAWTLTKLEVRDGCPVAVLASRLQTNVAAAGADPQGGSTMDGLDVEKTVTLLDGGNALTVAFALTNSSPRPLTMPAGFRVKNYPRLGAAVAQGKPLPAISRVRIQAANGAREITTAAPVNSTVFLPPDVREHPFLKVLADAKVESWTPGPVVIEAGAGAETRRLTIEPDTKATVGLYSWCSTASFTVELLSADLALPPGQTATYEQTIRFETGAAGK